MKGVRPRSTFLCTWKFSCSSSIVQKPVFSLLHCLCYFVKDQLTIFMWVYFWVSILFYWSTCLFSPVLTIWITVVHSKSWKQVVSISQLCLCLSPLGEGIVDLLSLHVNFRISLSISTKQLAGIANWFLTKTHRQFKGEMKTNGGITIGHPQAKNPWTST